MQAVPACVPIISDVIAFPAMRNAVRGMVPSDQWGRLTVKQVKQYLFT